MPGSGHSYHRDDGLKDFGGGLCILPKSGRKEVDLAYVMKPSGLQQGRHVAASAPVVVENRVIW